MQALNDRIVDLNVWNHNKLNLQYRNGALTNRSGVEWINNPFEESYTLGAASPAISVKSRMMSLYNDTKLFIGNRLTANIGLRGEYSAYLRRFNFAPRLYLGYALNRENILSASVGQYFQLPDMEYLKLYDSLDFTSVNKATVSYSHVKQSDKFQLDAYFKKYNNVVAQLEPSGADNGGDGFAWGADVFWKSSFKSLGYWLTCSYNHTEKKYDRFERRIAPDYVSPLVFNVVLKYWMSPLKSMLGVSYNIASGLPFYSETPPYDRLGSTPFHNRADLSWSYLPSGQVVVHLGVQNVFGYRNVYGYRYSRVHPGLRQEITSRNDRFVFLGVFVTLSVDKNLNQLKSL
jgi:hypothetical protein